MFYEISGSEVLTRSLQRNAKADLQIRVQTSAALEGAWASEVRSPSLVNGFRT
jgi:hypothetical protein